MEEGTIDCQDLMRGCSGAFDGRANCGGTNWARDPLKRRIHGSLIHVAAIEEKKS